MKKLAELEKALTQIDQAMEKISGTAARDFPQDIEAETDTDVDARIKLIAHIAGLQQTKLKDQDVKGARDPSIAGYLL